MRVLTGLDCLAAEGLRGSRGSRYGVLANQASVDHRLVPSHRVLGRVLPGRLSALFGPQHGHGGEDQDNMVETPHRRDDQAEIPVFSLYAENRTPDTAMLDLIDVLFIDLQDVGTRVYTFAWTMLGCLRAAAQAGKRVIVLDRPNPLGGQVLEGNLLRPELFSFVGGCPLPMRHGLTMGELAQLFNHTLELECDLQVIRMQGWRREMLWEQTGLRWLPPSPNMPLPETARVYPGQVIWEGTHASEGRGTCRPFEVFGAPYWNPGAIREHLDPAAMGGCHLQPYFFRPTFHKWHGERCRGFMLHVTDPARFRPYRFSLAALKAVFAVHAGTFAWRQPPYEYEYRRLPIDLILGDFSLREALAAGADVADLERTWQGQLQAYAEWRKPFLLY